MLKGKKATCYSGFDKFLEGAEYTGNMVEVVDNFILGKGPGAAPAFGFTILEKFAGAEKALEVKKGMLRGLMKKYVIVVAGGKGLRMGERFPNNSFR